MPGTFAAAAAAAGFTSWTTNSTPALARFVAIGIPIVPNPTKPTVSMGSPFTDSPRGARRRASAAAARLALPFVWQVRLAVECSAFARREECVGVTAVRARASTAQPSWGWLGGGRRGPLRLHQGPGIADPARVDREPPALDEGVGPPLERRALGGGRPRRRGDEAPAERFRQEVRRQLSREEARREVPERPLAARGLVDGQPGGAVEVDLGEECRIRAVRHSAAERDPTAREQGVSGRCR